MNSGLCEFDRRKGYLVWRSDARRPNSSDGDRVRISVELSREGGGHYFANPNRNPIGVGLGGPF